jgi:hypothetical protein
MRRLLVIPILLIGALLDLVAGTTAGNNDFVCDELVNEGTFDNVTVAKGGCGLYGTKVNGDIKNEGVLGLLLTTIVAGNVKSNGTIVLLEAGATVAGNINSDIGLVYVGNSTVGGNLNVVGESYLTVTQSTVGGNIKATGMSSFGVSRSQIGGNIQLTKSTIVSDDSASLNSNLVEGNINLSHNILGETWGGGLFENSVGGNVKCTKNSPEFQMYGGNQIEGKMNGCVPFALVTCLPPTRP